MDLIQEIKSDIIDSNVSLSVALRKAKVLASILKNDKMKEWVNNELNGYFGVERDNIPEYRKFHAQNFGHFSGPFQSGIRNAPIPLMVLPDSVREFAEYNDMLDGVKTLESYTNAEGGVLQSKWPADLIAYTQHNAKIYADMVLADAWKITTVSQVEGVLDTIRNRLLDFILELEENYPDSVKSEKTLKDIPEETVNNYVTNFIYGGQNVLATGSGFSQKTGDLVIHNSFDNLKKQLKQYNVPEEDIEELKKAIEEDGELKENKFGQNVSNWMGKITSKILNGSISLAKNAGPVVISEITKALMSYYGIS